MYEFKSPVIVFDRSIFHGMVDSQAIRIDHESGKTWTSRQFCEPIKSPDTDYERACSIGEDHGILAENAISPTVICDGAGINATIEVRYKLKYSLQQS